MLSRLHWWTHQSPLLSGSSSLSAEKSNTFNFVTLSSWEPTDLCFRLWILVWDFLLSFGSPFLGLLVVRSSVRRWPDTRESERIRKNRVEDSIMLVKADNLHRQYKKFYWLTEKKENRGLRIYAYVIRIFYTFLLSAPYLLLFWSLTALRSSCSSEERWARTVSLQSDKIISTSTLTL